MARKTRKLAAAARKRREIERLKKRARSEYVEVRDSPIHGSGVYAAKAIPAEVKVIEYIGERIDKEESERRAWAQMEKAEETGDAAVYIFTLNDRWDVDGSVEWNVARLINHSCEPNCEAWIVDDKRIEIHSLREIEPGEELSFDYGFDVENYEDHPCLCGAEGCVGYIVSREQWGELRERLEEEEAEEE